MKRSSGKYAIYTYSREYTRVRRPAIQYVLHQKCDIEQAALCELDVDRVCAHVGQRRQHNCAALPQLGCHGQARAR